MKNPSKEHRRVPTRSEWAYMLCLVAISVLVYTPAMNGGPLWDDDAWTTGIPHLLQSFDGLCRMWLEPGALQQYYPVSGTTFWLDYHLWGDWIFPYHLENVLLHALSAILFWRVLLRLRVPGAWFAGALFAVHPVMAESVAWITERKNVLAQVFMLAAVLAYGRFTCWWRAQPQPADHRRWLWYTLGIVFFALALLAKITPFSLPPALLLISWWRHGSLNGRRDVLPLLPFFAVSFVLGYLVMSIEHGSVGATGVEWDYPFAERWLIAGRAFWFYPMKLLWPLDLSFVYTKWQLDATSVWQWLYPVSALLLVAWLWLARQRIGRGPLTAVLLYVGSLSPLLGFLNVYGMRYSYVWDHWVYLPSLSLIALFTALVFRMPRHFRRPAIGAMLLILMGLTWRHTGTYVNAETHWRATLVRNPTCWMALNNLGILLDQNGRITEAKECLLKAIETEPGNYAAYANLGKLYLKQNDGDSGVKYLSHAVALKPDDVDLHVGLGLLQMSRGQMQQAAGHFVQALAIMPEHASAHDYLGLVMHQMGDPKGAIPHLNASLQLRPGSTSTLLNLGHALAAVGRLDEALARFNQALAIKPDYSEAYSGKGSVLLKMNKKKEAAVCLQKALDLQPTNIQMANFIRQTLSEINAAEKSPGPPVPAPASR